MPLVNIQLGEVIFGGVGSGLYGMLAFAIVAMFVAGLMVGRTPEYLGKKLEAKEVKMTILALLSLPLVDPGLDRARDGCAARARRDRQYRTARLLRDPLRLYLGAPATTAAPLRESRPTRSSTIRRSRFAMLIGTVHHSSSRCWPSPGRWRRRSSSRRRPGPFRPNRPLFVGLLVGVVLIIGGLTYFPAISLGPAVEQVAMNQGKLYPGP